MAAPTSWIDELSAAWRREYPDLDVSSLLPMVRLARLGVLIEAFQDEVLKPFELTRGDYGVLAALRQVGKPYEQSPGRLTNRLRRSSGGITKILLRLEERDLVERTPDPSDRRGVRIRMTAAGLALQQRVFDAFLESSDTLLAPLGKRNLKTSDQELATLLDIFEEWGDA
ncbi:MAG: MarR family transcriptional regulator [Proteobacteria bacterium]|nr:MarR family transcriptional regulator [Pseudomonadota bacterium]